MTKSGTETVSESFRSPPTLGSPQRNPPQGTGGTKLAKAKGTAKNTKKMIECNFILLKIVNLNKIYLAPVKFKCENVNLSECNTKT